MFVVLFAACSQPTTTEAVPVRVQARTEAEATAQLAIYVREWCVEVPDDCDNIPEGTSVVTLYEVLNQIRHQRAVGR